MGEVVRIGVSVDEHLLERFDRLLEERGIGNRSEAIRDLIRDHLVEDELEDDATAIGSVTIVYDHHTRTLSGGLTSLQHAHNHQVVSSMHVHIDERHCLEVIVLKGRFGEIQRLADRLIGAKGVLHGKLMATSLKAVANHSAALEERSKDDHHADHRHDGGAHHR